MAIINKTGITSGGTIQAEHVTRAIDALSGGSTDTVIATGSFSGSLTGTATISGSLMVYNPIDGSVTIDSDAYSLNNNGGGVTLNWDSSELYDTNISASIAWNQRQLKNSAGDVILDWQLAKFTGGLIGTASFATSASRAVTASFATTASYALNATGGSGAGFPYTGSAIISGSLGVTGSTSIENVTVITGLSADNININISANTDSVLNLQNAGVDNGPGFVLPIYLPNNPDVGSMYFDPGTGVLFIFDGSNWLSTTLT